MAPTGAEHEMQTLAMLRRALDEQAHMLASAGLVATEPRVTRAGTADTTESSEVVVEFLANEDIVDVIEFDLLRGGIPAMSMEEAARWLASALADVVRRQAQAG